QLLQRVPCNWRGRDSNQPTEIRDTQIGGCRFPNLANQEVLEWLRESGALLVRKVIRVGGAEASQDRYGQLRIFFRRQGAKAEIGVFGRRHAQFPHAVPQRSPQERAQERIGDVWNLVDNRRLAFRIEQEAAIRVIFIVAEDVVGTTLSDCARDGTLCRVERGRDALETSA